MNGLVINVLKEIGINPDRFSLQWASAAEAPRFVKLITQFTGKIKELGPLGESEGIGPDELQASLEKGLAAVSSKKVRMVYGNTAKTIRKDGIFTQEYISGVIEEKLSKAITGALSAEPEEEEPKSAPEKTAAADKPAPKAQKAAAEKPSPLKEVKKAAAIPKKTAAEKAAPKTKAAKSTTKKSAKKAAAKKKK